MDPALKANVRGMVIPLRTPFLEDGDVDTQMLHALVDFYLGAGVQGLFVLGSFGEGPACPPELRKRVAELVLNQVRGRIPTIIHVGAVDYHTSVDLARHARDLGAPAIGIVGPYYYSDRSEADVIEHYAAVDRAVDLPILVYNNPPYQGFPMPPSLLQRLVERVPNVFAMKLAGGSVADASPYLKVLPDLSLFALAENLFPGLVLGLKGTISPPLAPFPELGLDIVRAVDAGDFDAATRAQIRAVEYLRSGISPIDGFRLRGFDMTYSRRRPGATRPSPEAQQRMREKAESLGLPIAQMV